MHWVFIVGGFVVFFGLAYWYIEVYTERKHWREACEEVAAMERWEQSMRPPKPTCDGCHGERARRCCNFSRRPPPK